MKKFLIVLLVLALGSAASAYELALVTSDPLVAGTTIQVDLVNVDFPCSGIAKIDFVVTGSTEITAAGGAWVSPMAAAPGGGDGALSGAGAGNSITRAEGYTATGGTNANIGTVLYSFDLTLHALDGQVAPVMTDGAFDYAFENPGPSYYAASEITLTPLIIPEPMTIALLGLGGLFLRRRK